MRTTLLGNKKLLLFGNRENLSLVVLVLILLILMTILSPGRFYRIGNLRSMASQMPELGFLSLGMMIVMISGGINLAVIATANMAGIITALVMQQSGGPEASALAVFLAVAAGLAVVAIVGLANGALVTYVGVSPILATLGMMTLLNGIMTVITKGYVISGFPPLFQFVGNGRILGIPFPLILLILIFSLFSLLFRRSPFGLALSRLGTIDVAARPSGIRTHLVILKTYVFSALLSGMAGMVMISRFNSAKFDYGESYLLVTVLAAVLGGTNVYGGFGKVSGLLLSLVILQIVSSSLNLLQVNAFLTRAIWGLILVAVMMSNYLRNKNRG